MKPSSIPTIVIGFPPKSPDMPLAVPRVPELAGIAQADELAGQIRQVERLR
jgi:hypothetical protein